MKRPSFQFYPADWLSDPNVVSMTAEERGAYIHLLAFMWNTDDCSLNNDEEYLARLSGVNKVVIRSLLHLFNKSDKGVIRHNRLDRERGKQDGYRKACSEAGKIGMQKRWGAKTKAKDKVVITKHNSSSSSSSSSSSKEKYIYGEFSNVKLLKAEFNKLIDKFGERLAEKIESLSSYIASTGKKYSSHYATILNWARKDETPAFKQKEDDYDLSKIQL